MAMIDRRNVDEINRLMNKLERLGSCHGSDRHMFRPEFDVRSVMMMVPSGARKGSGV